MFRSIHNHIKFLICCIPGARRQSAHLQSAGRVFTIRARCVAHMQRYERTCPRTCPPSTSNPRKSGAHAAHMPTLLRTCSCSSVSVFARCLSAGGLSVAQVPATHPHLALEAVRGLVALWVCPTSGFVRSAEPSPRPCGQHRRGRTEVPRQGRPPAGPRSGRDRWGERAGGRAGGRARSAHTAHMPCTCPTLLGGPGGHRGPREAHKPSTAMCAGACLSCTL